MELTDAGRILLDATRPGYSVIDQALETVREKEGITQGCVHLAAVHTLSYYFTADVVADFVGTRPHVNLSLKGRSAPEVVELVETGKADVGFVYDSAVASPDLTTIPLFEDEMCLIMREAEAYPDGVDLTVAAPRFVGFPPNYALRKMLEGGGIRPEFAAVAETVDAMLRLVSSGSVPACCPPACRTASSGTMVSRSFASTSR